MIVLPPVDEYTCTYEAHSGDIPFFLILSSGGINQSVNIQK